MSEGSTRATNPTIKMQGDHTLQAIAVLGKQFVACRIITAQGASSPKTSVIYNSTYVQSK